ncbi:MAG TPA: 5-oxoprolinase/urea amidolyase family protein [Acidimicrobiales bacterium]|nr:5-oxoprolinase/urea amidolyase family protein [Acidimicrobiales bacterium]
MRLLPVGERAVLAEFPCTEDVHRMWLALEAGRPAGIDEVVAGARTLLFVVAEDAGDPFAVVSRLPEPAGPAGGRRPRTVSIPVTYDGPDLAGVAEMAGLDPDEVVRLHSGETYTVGFLGFSPGFAYLFGGHPRLAVPRLASPRTSVPAGSVALAGDMTAVYPQSTPGGWRIIGRTGTAMFDPFRAAPALLAPGDRVRFRPVEDAPSAPTSGLGSGSRSALRATPGADDRGGLEILDPGLLLTVQDMGRRGWAHAGVPLSGAADRRSAALANHLVGNPPEAAVLESTLGTCRLRLRHDRVVAVTGAAADVTVDGLPARRHVGLPLRAGSELTVGRAGDGARMYIAVAGGLEVDAVLGSRSTDTLSGLGPAPLRRGDVLPLGTTVGSSRRGRPPVTTAKVTPLPGPTRSIEVQARLGPRADWLSPAGLAALGESAFRVGGSSDRTGVRLQGPALRLDRSEQLPSEGMVAGAVQVPPDGQPIVLMRNHPPTGGYPVVAVVDDEGVDALAQAAPGDTVRLCLSPARTPGSGRG